MTRPFRLEEDERRYFALRSEFFIRLVQSGVPAQTVHDIMRNFGKLEDVMFFEGVRQGAAASILAGLSPAKVGFEPHQLSAIEVHASVYRHDASTPLTRVERTIVFATGMESHLDHPWLDAEPLEFAPLTLNEAIEKYGPDLVVKPAARQQQAAAPQAAPKEPLDLPDIGEEDADDLDAEKILEALANGEDPGKLLGAPAITEGDDLSNTELQEPIELPLDEEPIHKPALLDRIRDELLRLEAPPKAWHEMILHLMRNMRVDAAHLDEVLSTPMGMTVISQANLFHLHPGAIAEVKMIPRPT